MMMINIIIIMMVSFSFSYFSLIVFILSRAIFVI